MLRLHVSRLRYGAAWLRPPAAPFVRHGLGCHQCRQLKSSSSVVERVRGTLRGKSDTLQHGTYAINALSLLFADIAILRLFATASNVLALADVYVCPVSTMSGWHARWNMLFLTTNVIWLGIIVNERFAWLSEEEEELYLDAFKGCFSRPQFRTLMKKGSALVAHEPTVIIEENHPSNVFLVLNRPAAAAACE